MGNDKVKFYKNSDRNKTVVHTPYVPQYQQLGIEPEEYKSPLAPAAGHVAIIKPEPLPKDNPRAPRAVIRQPYAEAIASPIGRGRGPVPNVGNNMEHTWSSVDGEIIDDLTTPQVDPNHPMIDNNDFVDVPGSESTILMDSIEVEYETPPKNFLTEEELKNALKEEDIAAILQSVAEDECVLMIDGVAICSGSSEDIQEQVRDLVFGEHELCDGNPVAIDDIVVFKRMKVKVGVFLE